MKILQLSDIHIDSVTDIEIAKIKLTKMKESILSRLVPGEELVIFVCGDIIDKGDLSLFETASRIFDYMKNDLFTSFTVKFEFVPGNHDLCKGEFVDFDNFTKEYTEVQYEYNARENSHLRKYNGIDAVLTNSTFHKDITNGKLDIQELKNLTIENPTILVVHHTLLSENDNDTSAIRNAYKLIEWVENNNIIAIMHGHTHGYKNIVIGETCRVIGVGPFLKQVPDINNQFNFIEISEGRIDKVSNYRYNGDFDKFSCHDVYIGERCSNFMSSSVKALYETIVRETKYNKSIYNLKANLSSEFDFFEKEIQTHFSDILPIALDWQSKSVPESLYYNHGEYMQTESIWGMDYIIRELMNKSTSSRAIIPLIDFNMVANSKDRFLPSLNIIQFGFSDDQRSELYLTLYLRALEVKNFLKINLCEAYIMAKQIKDSIRSIQRINLAVIAYKAQYKEKYGCFRKARIDSVTESVLTISIIEKDFKAIIDMLEEKIDLSETVIQDHGLENLNKALLAVSNKGKCSRELYSKTEIILEKLRELKVERERTSDYNAIEKIEHDVNMAIRNLIDEFKLLGGQ